MSNATMMAPHTARLAMTKRERVLVRTSSFHPSSFLHRANTHSVTTPSMLQQRCACAPLVQAGAGKHGKHVHDREEDDGQALRRTHVELRAEHRPAPAAAASAAGRAVGRKPHPTSSARPVPAVTATNRPRLKVKNQRASASPVKVNRPNASEIVQPILCAHVSRWRSEGGVKAARCHLGCGRAVWAMARPRNTTAHT
jgi:hypothetical protein